MVASGTVLYTFYLKGCMLFMFHQFLMKLCSVDSHLSYHPLDICAFILLHYFNVTLSFVLLYSIFFKLLSGSFFLTVVNLMCTPDIVAIISLMFS